MSKRDPVAVYFSARDSRVSVGVFEQFKAPTIRAGENVVISHVMTVSRTL